MTEVTRTRAIHAEPKAVWDVLAEFDSISRWADNVAHSCVLERPDDEGTIGLARRVQVGRNALIERIVAIDPPTSLAYDIHGLPPRLRTVRNRWSVAADHSGSLVSLTTTVEIGPRPPQRIAERVVGAVMARQSDVMLAGLAHHLEDPRV